MLRVAYYDQDKASPSDFFVKPPRLNTAQCYSSHSRQSRGPPTTTARALLPTPRSAPPDRALPSVRSRLAEFWLSLRSSRKGRRTPSNEHPRTFFLFCVSPASINKQQAAQERRAAGEGIKSGKAERTRAAVCANANRPNRAGTGGPSFLWTRRS